MSDISRLPRRRHDPPDHQQPDRLHHQPAGGAQLAVLQRRRQDGAGADLPRQRRRPRGVRARRRAGLRVPPEVPQGRRHRHGLLPPPRPQRGRRPELHAAADVQGDRRAAQRAQALRRGARQARRAHRRGGRERARRLPGASCRSALDQTARARTGDGQGGQAAQAGRACCRTSRPASPRATLDAIFDHLTAYPGRLHRRTPSWSASSRRARSCTTSRARSTGRRPRRWRSARWCSRARRCASPARTPAAARSASATPRSSTTRTSRCGSRSHDLPGAQAAVLGLRQPAQRVRRARLRVRLRAR